MPVLVLSVLKIIEQSDKRIQGQLVIIQKEVAERKKAEEDAVRSNIEKSNFLSNMSHELKTPLNSIIGFSQRLVRKKDTFLGDDFFGNGKHFT